MGLAQNRNLSFEQKELAIWLSPYILPSATAHLLSLINLSSTNQMLHARGSTVYYFLSCDPQLLNGHGNDEFYS